MARDRVVAQTTPPGGRCLATITAVTILTVVALVVVSANRCGGGGWLSSHPQRGE